MSQLKAANKDKDQHIKVFVRVRPLNENERAAHSLSVIDCPSKRELVVHERPTASDKLSKKFTFDEVFGPHSKQIDVYKCVVHPLITDVLAGYNCTVFAYGQTSTGKTFTMEGEKSSDPLLTWHSDPLTGIIPRAMSHLFDELRFLRAEFSVRVSFLELYNEELFDLLSPMADCNKLKLFEDATRKGAVIVHGLEEVAVQNKNEVYEIMERGCLKRQTAATLMNAHSSRSHTVFSITVHVKENSMEGDEMLKIGKLNLVDLAGSENIGRSGAVDKRAREAGSINQSLLTLGRVITALVERTPHVPYRESKLTRLLRESLGGCTKTSIIATVSPSFCNIEESLSTLEYARRARRIQNQPEINQKLTKKALIKEYLDEMERLRRDLMAARERSGIYIAAENYNHMLMQIETQKQEMAELLGNVKTLEETLEKKEALNHELTLSLARYNEELQQTQEELLLSKDILSKTEYDRDEKAYLVQQHVNTEETLLQQAHCLLDVVNASLADADKLHNSLDKKRLLENDNKYACYNFHAFLGGGLKALESDVMTFLKQEKLSSDEFKEKLAGSTKDMVRQRDELGLGVSSMIDGQISSVEGLKETFGQLSVMQEMVESLRRSSLQDKIVHLLQNVLQNSKNLQKQNMLLRNHMKQMEQAFNEKLQDHAKRVQTFTEGTVTKLKQLCGAVDEQLEQLEVHIEAKNGIDHSLEEDTCASVDEMYSAIEEIDNQMQTMKNVLGSVLSKMNSKTKAKHENVLKQQASKDSIDRIMKSLCSTVISSGDVISLCSGSTAKCTEDMSMFAKETLSTADVIDDSCVAMVSDLEEARAHCREEGAKREALNEGILEQLSRNQERFLEQSETLIGTLEKSKLVHANMQQTQVCNLIDVDNSWREMQEKQHSRVKEWSRKFVAKTQSLNEGADRLFEQDLQDYIATGDTPKRPEYQYPKILAVTSPHERIVSRFRSLRNEVEKPLSETPVPQIADGPRILRSSSDTVLDPHVKAGSGSPVLKSCSANDIFSTLQQHVTHSTLHSESSFALSENKENCEFALPRVWKRDKKPVNLKSANHSLGLSPCN